MEMKKIFARLLNHETLTSLETHDILLGITREEIPVEQISALLTAIQMRGITAEELIGFRNGILETGIPVSFDADSYIDIVGTGGDGKNTFNISTCACFVVAGAGYKVAKHGNYSATSVSGSSNVLEGFGVKFTNDNLKLNASLVKCGFAYLHAPLFAKAMKYVAPVRKAIPFPTLFNLLGPLVNPSQPPCQLLGVANLDQMRLYDMVNQKLGIKYGIETSLGGYDEISLTGDFKIKTNSYEKLFKPSDIGLGEINAQNIFGGKTKEEARTIFGNVLKNEANEDPKNVVLANAAFAIQILDGEKDITECLAMARESLESGKAYSVFEKFVSINS